MSFMLLTEHHFEFPSLKGDCRGSSESESALTLKALLYVTFSCSIRCSGSGVILIVSIPDICVLPYFLYSHEYRLTRNIVYCANLSDQIVVGCPLGVPISYYRGYIIFAFSVIVSVCLSVGRSVNFFYVKDFSAAT